MPYTSLIQLGDRYGERLLTQLTDRGSEPSGVIDEAVVARALADADAVIDGYLAGRYALPLAEVPPLLADLAQALAIYKLHMFEADPKISQDYKDALAMLDRISRGVVRLAAAGAEPASSGSTGVEVVDRDRPFTAENMAGFI